MYNQRPQLKKGMKALSCKPKEREFFHLPSATLSFPIYPGHADAFKAAADLVLTAHPLAINGPNRDTLVFPAVYLYRHCLELKLKDFVRLGVLLGTFNYSKKVERILGEHALLPLWNKTKNVLVDAHAKDSEVQIVQAIVNEFHNVDPDGHTLRYDRERGQWKTRDYKDLPSHIGIETLRTTMDAVYRYLEFWYAGIVDWRDANRP